MIEQARHRVREGPSMKRSASPAPALLRMLWPLLMLGLVTGVAAQTSASGSADDPTEAVVSAPVSPSSVFASAGPDTLRTNLQLAEALLGEAVQAILPELPPPPAVIVLVPGSTEQSAVLLTNVANHWFAEAGYTVYLEEAPAESASPVFEFRFRVENLQLTYPETGRRLVFWKSWVGRQMDLAVQATVTDAEGQVLVSRRQTHAYQDRVPVEFMAAVESPTYEFTRAERQAGSASRRMEQVVVLGTLAALVAVYFANTE